MMTKITVDKITALRAVCKYFDIQVLGTPLSGKVGNLLIEQDINIEFDFECKHGKD
jgi:hypothetical protein